MSGRSGLFDVNQPKVNKVEIPVLDAARSATEPLSARRRWPALVYQGVWGRYSPSPDFPLAASGCFSASSWGGSHNEEVDAIWRGQQSKSLGELLEGRVYGMSESWICCRGPRQGRVWKCSSSEGRHNQRANWFYPGQCQALRPPPGEAG